MYAPQPLQSELRLQNHLLDMCSHPGCCIFDGRNTSDFAWPNILPAGREKTR